MPTHKKPESERFKGPVKYLEYLVARALIALLQGLPIGLACRLGRVIGWLAWKTLSSRRRTVRKNLEIVNAWMDARSADAGEMMTGSAGTVASGGQFEQNREDSHPASLALPPEAQVKEVFLRNGANLFGGFTFGRMGLEETRKHLEIDGLEHLEAALEKGKGAIVLLAHQGPWEALTQLPALARSYGIEAPFGALYRPFNNFYLEQWFRRVREDKGTRLFVARHRFYAPVDFNRDGGILGVLADQRASGGETVTFFGRSTKATPLPGLLHLRSGAPMLTLAMATLGPARWQLTLRPADPETNFGSDQRRAELAQHIAGQMEKILISSPLDGFWFHDRFKERRKRNKPK